MFTLRDVPEEVTRELFGTVVLGKALLAISAATSAAYKTTNAINYAIDGIVYTKAAAGTVAMSAGHQTQGVSEERYYTVQIDAAGNLSTKQSANFGPVPKAGEGRENGQSYSFATGLVAGVTLSNPVVITTGAAHNRQTGDKIRLEGIQGPGQLNNREFKVRRDGTTTVALFTNDGVAVDGRKFDPYVAGGTWTETHLARAIVGAIKVVTGATTTFVPGTTVLDAAGVTATYIDFSLAPGVDRP